MRQRHSREQILDGALEVALADGVSQVTFGRVGRRLGISDRTVVYYFPTKEDLVADVLLAVGARLQTTLAAALTSRAPDHVALARSLWPLLTTSESDPVFSLFFEATGLAAAGRRPYDEVVPLLVDAWIAWAAGMLEGTPVRRRAGAGAAVALLDGLLLLRQLAGPATSERAARALGVAGSAR